MGLNFQPDDWVGGDYVDIVPLSDGRVFFGLADVCGKGMSSAMIATAIWSSVRCLLAEGAEVGGLMSRLNAHLCQMLPPASFVRCSPRATRPPARCGMRTPAIRPPGCSAPTPVRGCPGATAPYHWVSSRRSRRQYAKLDPGDLLALYTDGCCDRAGSDGALLEPADLATLLGELAGNADLQLQKVADVLADRLAEMEARSSDVGMIHDDTTLLLIRYAGASRPSTPFIANRPTARTPPSIAAAGGPPAPLAAWLQAGDMTAPCWPPGPRQSRR